MNQDQSEIILTNRQLLFNLIKYLSISSEQIRTFLWNIESNLYRTSSTLSKEFMINHKASKHKTYHFGLFGKAKDLQSTWSHGLKLISWLSLKIPRPITTSQQDLNPWLKLYLKQRQKKTFFNKSRQVQC